MSHELTIKNNVAEMAYVGAKPWHGLGQELKPGASIEQWLKSAGMEWEVERATVQYAGRDNQGSDWAKAFLSKHVLYRSDSHEPLGVVSAQYKIVQPKQVLEFFRELCEFNKFKLETAGTLFGGRIYWALANMNEDASVLKGDDIRGRLLLSTSADGTKSTVAKFVAERVVCNNTLTIASKEKGGRLVKTTHRSEFNIGNVHTDLGVGHDQFKDFIKTAKLLSQVPVTPEQATQYMVDLLNTHGGVDRGDKVEKSKPFTTMMKLYEGEGKGSTMSGVKGTAWGLVNAVTEYMDHHRRAALPDNRLNTAWFGFGERLKMKAFDLAQTIVAKKAKSATKKGK